MTPRPLHTWRLRNRSLTLGIRTLVLGVLNVTPDSFSDGGLWLEKDSAIACGLAMLDQGADILDLGGESTRPNAAPVTAAEEQDRVLPVLRGILRARPHAILSVDTYHADTAERAVEAGAEIVNDVSGGLWDAAMPGVWARTGCGVILMHTRGRPQEWRTLPGLGPEEVVPLVCCELGARLAAAHAAGVARDAIALDPGFGFGKAFDENYPLLAGLAQLQQLGLPLVAGASRKGFLRRTLEHATSYPGTVTPEALRDATTAANVAAVLAGASILRVHDVTPAVHAAAVADRVLAAAPLQQTQDREALTTPNAPREDQPKA